MQAMAELQVVLVNKAKEYYFTEKMEEVGKGCFEQDPVGGN